MDYRMFDTLCVQNMVSYLNHRGLLDIVYSRKCVENFIYTNYINYIDTCYIHIHIKIQHT